MYITQEIAERIKNRAKAKNITLKCMLSDCGLGINTISEFSKGKQLSCISLATIADYLDCSIDYLMGRTDNPYVTIEAKDEMELELLKAFKSLGFSEKIEVMNTIIEKRNKL